MSYVIKFEKKKIKEYQKICNQSQKEFDEDDIFKLENYCNKWGIKQNKWKEKN